MKIFQKIFFGISIIVFIGLCYISFFNVFQTDDYIYAAHTRKIGIIGNIVGFYNNWGGRFFTYSINAFIPAGNQNFFWLPKILPISYFIFLILGFYKNFRFYFNLNKTEALQKSFILFLFYTVCLSSISEHYFWISGANVYFLPLIVSNFLIYYFGLKYHNKNFSRVIMGLIFFLMGSNEFIAIYLLLFLNYNYFLNKEKESLLYLILGAIGFLISFLAPGNFNRLQESELNFWRKNLVRGSVFIYNSGYILIKILIILPLFIKIYVNEIKIVTSKVSINKIRVVFLFSLILLFFSGILILKSERSLELITFYTMLVGSVLIYKHFIKIRKFYLISLFVIFLPKIPINYKSKSAIYFNYNLYNIFVEITTFPLLEYEEEVNLRHNLLTKCSEEIIFLKPIKAKPTILYFKEIGAKEQPNFINRQLEKFYNKREIYLETENP